MSLMFLGHNKARDIDAKTVECYCEGHCPEGQDYGTCHTLPGGKCFTAVEVDLDEEGEEYPLLSYGCLPPYEMALFQCRATLLAIREAKTMKCCDEYDKCNQQMLPDIPKKAQKIQEEPSFDHMTMNILLSSISLSLVVLIIILAVAFLKYRKSKLNQPEEHANSHPTINISNVHNLVNYTMETNNAPPANLSMGANTNTTSDESSGLVQRTAGQQVTKDLLIAKGKYSEVWKAKWRYDTVAVKIYFNKEHIFLRDIDFYQMLRADNILGFIAADIREKTISNEMMLITEYCECSLEMYLKENTLDVVTLLKMSKDILTGLALLHAEVIGVRGRPAVAHNNLHSSNILIKSNNMVCCLADFGKSVKFFSSPKHYLDAPNDTINNKLRYLAPEILINAFDKLNFECYKMSDIYAVSLIMWQLLNRCKVTDVDSVGDYQKPFEDELGNDDEIVTLDLVKSVVVDKNLSPEIRDLWKNNDVLKIYSKLLEETWNKVPSKRLTCLRVKKNINNLINSLPLDSPKSPVS